MQISMQMCDENPRFIFLMVNGNPWRKVSKRLFFRHLKKLKQVQTLEELEESWQFIESKRSKEMALRLLSRRDYFPKELEKKLLEEGLSPQAVAEAILHCRRWGYLNEEDSICRFLNNRKGKKGALFFKIALQNKGVAADRIAHFLKQVEPSEVAVIKQLLSHKKNLSEPGEKRKWIQRLQRRGFCLDAIYSALQQI